MKEFIEKLIGRLEEEHERCINQYGVVGGNIPASIVRRCMNITEELAEEYSADTPQKSAARWIPCSERLPESNGWYLVTNVLGVVQQQYWGASHWQKLRDEAVIAWMPLPEPYIEQQKELSTAWQQQTMNRFERVE